MDVALCLSPFIEGEWAFEEEKRRSWWQQQLGFEGVDRGSLEKKNCEDKDGVSVLLMEWLGWGPFGFVNSPAFIKTGILRA